MRAIQPSFAFLSSGNPQTFPGRILRLILTFYAGMPSPTSGPAVLLQGDYILESYSLYQLSTQDYSVLHQGKDTKIVSMESRFNNLDSIRWEYLYSSSVGLHIVALIPIRQSFMNLIDEVVNLWIFVDLHRRVDIVWMSPSHVQRLTLVRRAKSTIVRYKSTFVQYISRRPTTLAPTNEESAWAQ